MKKFLSGLAFGLVVVLSSCGLIEIPVTGVTNPIGLNSKSIDVGLSNLRQPELLVVTRGLNEKTFTTDPFSDIAIDAPSPNKLRICEGFKGQATLTTTAVNPTNLITLSDLKATLTLSDAGNSIQLEMTTNPANASVNLQRLGNTFDYAFVGTAPQVCVTGDFAKIKEILTTGGANTVAGKVSYVSSVSLENSTLRLTFDTGSMTAIL